MAELWCVEVAMHETVIPQPSKVAAEAVAKLWNEEWVATLWPWTEKQHADELAKHGGMPDDYS